MEDDKNEKQLKWKTTCIHREMDVTDLRFAGFLGDGLPASPEIHFLRKDVISSHLMIPKCDWIRT